MSQNSRTQSDWNFLVRIPLFLASLSSIIISIAIDIGLLCLSGRKLFDLLWSEKSIWFYLSLFLSLPFSVFEPLKSNSILKRVRFLEVSIDTPFDFEMFVILFEKAHTIPLQFRLCWLEIAKS